ncbi:MAG: response regulator, partial [Bdellovibrionales bacterium]|nr:response regulator [Bdellovibrionales bacterium]
MKNILVADDSSFFRSQVVKTLQTSGYQVTEAKDGQEALELLLLDPCIEIAIVDWNMPYLNGPEVCKQVRKLRPESYVYFILLTSQEGIEHLIEGMDSGADDYITKSQSLDEVHARLRAGSRIVDLHRSLHEEKERLSEANTALRETTKRLKEKEQELHDTLVLQNEVLSSIPSFCISLDTDYTVKTWNKRAEELFGLSSPEVCKKPIQALPLHWDISQITSSLEWCSLHIRPVELQSLRYNQIDGLLGKELDVCITPIESAEKVIEGYLLTGIDVTHSRQL